MASVDFMDGSLSGKLEQVVGVSRAHQKHVRRYVVPHDPQTVDQLARRARVKKIAEWGSRLPLWMLQHPTMIQPYRQTWHNRLMVDNQPHINGPAIDKDKWQIHTGTLPLPVTHSWVNGLAFNSVFFYHSTELQGEGEASDVFLICVHNVTNDTYHRSIAHVRTDVPKMCFVGAEGDYFYCWTFCWKPGKNLFSITVGDYRHFV